MTACHEIIDNPDSSNNKLFVVMFKRTAPLESVFYFLTNLLVEQKQSLKDM